MKKLLLASVCSFGFVMPVLAQDVSPPPSYEASKEAAKAVVEEAVTQEDVEGDVAQDAAEAVEALNKAVNEAKAPVVAEPATAEIGVRQNLTIPASPPPEVVKDSIAEAATTSVSASVYDGTKWGYTGGEAAPYWGTLEEGYAVCNEGEKQSPVNIAKFLQEEMAPLEGAYNPSPLSIVNNGHTIQVNFEPGSGFSVDDTRYELLHMHFHTPSEHYLDGAPYPMEIQFVHKAAEGTLAVIGVMMKVGDANPVIEGIWQNAPINAGGEKTVESVKISAADLMPATLGYYKYEGSLTTPPCSEGVLWHVMKEPIELSEGQLKAFQALFPVNARPIQPLGERVITGG